MTRNVLAALIGIAAGAMLSTATANEERDVPDPLDLAMIPGASGLGWVEVKRRLDATDLGWHCNSPGHLYSIYEIRHGGLPELHADTWTLALGAYLKARMTKLSEEATSAYPMPKPSLSWRGWLRQTLEKINAMAEREGMSLAAKQQALQNWVTCHIGEAEAEGIRQLIHDDLADGGKG